MKKVLASLGSLLLVYTMLGSSALALFLPQTRLTGMQFRTSSFQLLVKGNSNTTPIYKPEDTLEGSWHLHPEMTLRTEDFVVENPFGSDSVTLTGKILSGNQDWNLLKEVVRINVKFMTDVQGESGWFSLAEWSEQARSLPGGTLSEGQHRDFQFQYDFADTYPSDPDGVGPLTTGAPIGNELVNKMTQQVVFEITGTPLN